MDPCVLSRCTPSLAGALQPSMSQCLECSLMRSKAIHDSWSGMIRSYQVIVYTVYIHSNSVIDCLNHEVQNMLCLLEGADSAARSTSTVSAYHVHAWTKGNRKQHNSVTPWLPTVQCKQTVSFSKGLGMTRPRLWPGQASGFGSFPVLVK